MPATLYYGFDLEAHREEDGVDDQAEGEKCYFREERPVAVIHTQHVVNVMQER